MNWKKALFFGVSFLTLISVVPAVALEPPAERVVYLLGRLSEEEQISLTSALASKGEAGVVLIHSPIYRKENRHFLNLFRPKRIIPVGNFYSSREDLENYYGFPTQSIQRWESKAKPCSLSDQLFPSPQTMVISVAHPRRFFLQAACLAGTLQAPLMVLPYSRTEDPGSFLPKKWKPRNLFVCGPKKFQSFSKRVVFLQSETEIQKEVIRHLKGKLKTLVVNNPSGNKDLSNLAPWIAAQKRGLLFLTEPSGRNVSQLVCSFTNTHPEAEIDNVLLLGDLSALPMERRRNPILSGKDAFIEVEPLTPKGENPVSFAVGRVFHPRPEFLCLWMARRHLLNEPTNRRQALVASNSSDCLPLMETFSRVTSREIHNHGIQTHALFGEAVEASELRALLPQIDFFLWEGHHSKLIQEFGVHRWREPMKPSLVFLQSCLALTTQKAQPFIDKGAVAVIGTSSRTYSASGGAIALSFFDALLYDRQSVGSSLRQAKNFLLAYNRLQKKRLGSPSKLQAANLRAAWGFTLWGDPTIRWEFPERPLLPALRAKVDEKSITITIPDRFYSPVTTSHYLAKVKPNTRMAGLHLKSLVKDRHPMIPLAFFEVALHSQKTGWQPKLKSELSERDWVFLWDSRRKVGYLLIRVPDKSAEIRFHMSWEK